MRRSTPLNRRLKGSDRMGHAVDSPRDLWPVAPARRHDAQGVLSQLVGESLAGSDLAATSSLQ